MSLSLFGGTPRKPVARSGTPSQTPMRGIRFPSQTPPPIHHSDLAPLVSYHAVHAHLPAATSSTSGSNGEGVQHYKFPYDQLGMEEHNQLQPYSTPGAQRFQFNPQHALSVNYSPSTSILARVIDNGKTLELRYIATTTPSEQRQKNNAGNILRVDFDEVLHDISVSGCFYHSHSEDTGESVIVVIDKKSRIYTLSFPRPSLSSPGAFSWKYDPANMHVGWLSMSEPDMVASGMTITGSEPLVWSVIGKGVVLVGVRDGVLRCRMDNDDWTHEYFRRPTSLHRNLFRSDPFSQTRVISFAHDPASDLIYAVTKDKKLRIWNVGSLLHEGVIDLAQTSGGIDRRPQDTTNLEGGSSDMPSSPLVQILKGTQDTEYDKYIIVFTPTPRSLEGAGYFQVFGANSGSSTNWKSKKDLTLVGFLTCSSGTVGMDFRGFNVERVVDECHSGAEFEEDVEYWKTTTWRLWAAWDLKGKPFLEWSDLSALFEPKDEEMGLMASSTWQVVAPTKESLGLEPIFDSAYFDDALNEGIEDGSLGVDQIARFFVERLFYPGRFSQGVLSGALRDYIGGLQDGDAMEEEESEGFRTVKDQIGETVGRHLLHLLDEDMSAHGETDVRRRFKLEWQAFWIMVQQNDIQGRWPISLVPMNSDGEAAMVLCREGIIVAAVEDSVMMVRRLMVDHPDADVDIEELDIPVDPMEKKQVRDLLQAPKGNLENYHMPLEDAELRPRIVAGLASASTLAQALGPDDFFAFQKEAIRVEARDLYFEYMKKFSGTIEQNLKGRKSLSGSADPRKVLHAVLDFILDLQTDKTSGTFRDTFTGLSLRVSNMQQIIASRQLVAAEVLLLATYLMAQNNKWRHTLDQNDVYLSIAKRARTVFLSWDFLRRLSEKDSDEAQHTFKGSAGPSIRVAFLTLREEKENDSDASAVGETAYSLLHAIQRERPPNQGKLELRPHSFTMSTMEDVFLLGLVQHREQIVASVNEAGLARNILLSGNAESCLEFIDWFPRSAGITYVEALALIVSGADSDSAVDHLNQVAAAISLPGWALIDKTGLTSVLPDCVRWNGLAEYYKHAHAICRTAKLVAPAIMFAKRSIAETEDPHAAQGLMRYIFNESLSTQQYEEAWQAMLANPIVDHDSIAVEDDRPLGAIINSMCKSGQAQRLFSLPISGMEGYIEDELDLRARTADPLAAPFYHKVLYSWLIMRQDFRKAALTMYQYAQRVGSLTARSSAEYHSHLLRRSRALLTASNSLSLVEMKNAWFTTLASSKPGKDERSHKRARVACNVPTSEYTQAVRREIDIVTLDQVKKESDHVLAMLTISNHTSSELDPASPLSAVDCIAMLSEAGLFEPALASASVQEVDKSVVFEYLTTRCLEMDGMTDEAIRELRLATWLDTYSETATWRGSLVEKAWKYLDRRLSQHDVPTAPSKHSWGRKVSAGTNFTYHLAVLNRLLEVDPDYAVPQWLVARLVERCPDALIRAALKAGATAKAAGWARDSLKWAQNQQPRTVGAGIIAPQYSPFNAIDQVISAAKGSEDKSVLAAVDILKAEAARRFKGIKSLTSTIERV